MKNDRSVRTRRLRSRLVRWILMVRSSALAAELETISAAGTL